MAKKIREFSPAEIEERRVKRKSGELEDDPLPVDPRRRTRIYVTLDPDAVTIARRIGNGVVSRGIDRALFAFKSTKGRKKHVKETETT